MTTIDHPEFGWPVNYSTAPLPDNNHAQVASTIAMMRRYVVEDSDRPEFVNAVGDFVAGYIDRASANPCDIAYAFAKKVFRFQRDETTGGPLDPDAVEVLIRPADAVLMQGSGLGKQVPGDCDCFSMLVAATLRVLRVPCAFATVSADSRNPSAYSHVYVVAWPGSELACPIDASHGPFAGWEAPNLGLYTEWPLMGGGGAAGVVLGFVLALAGMAWYSGWVK